MHVSGETEVGDLHNVVLRHKDVSGCQVSVDALREEEQMQIEKLSAGQSILLYDNWVKVKQRG